MLQNTLNTTLGGGMSTTANATQDLEAAGRLVDKHLNYDSCFPSLLEMLRITPQGGATVSGLSESDYPSGGDGRNVRHLHTVRKVPLPSELLHHFQHMQCNCMMGLFPDITRAWLTIDSDIYVWVYEDGSDLAYFDGLHDTILSVGLVKPKTGVFKSYIEHLLCLTTPSEIVLLGVSFSNPAQGEQHSGMHLLPEPLFSVTTEGAYILTIKGSKDGRIFLGAKDGSLYELVYQAEDGWFSRKCYKVNHSRSSLSYILPSFLTLSEDDPINQIEIDNSRHIAYTLSEKGTVCVYDLGSDGKSTTKVVAMSHNNIINNALQVAKTIDKTNFKNVVSVCPIETSESPHVHLVIITGTGVRLYYTTMPLNCLSNSRPSQLTLLHVRLPPGFAANSITHRPTKVHKALYSFGTGVLCASESNESDVVWTVSGDQYPYHPALAESQAVMSVDGYVWALADVTPPLWCSALNPPTQQGTRPPLLVTQHQQEPRQLVLLSATGAHILTTLRPVDQLKLLLQECGGSDGVAVKDFFAAMSPTQACTTALILAMDPTLLATQIAEWATRSLFRYGIPPPAVSNTINMNFSGLQMPGNLSFQPSQVSTPLHGTVASSNQGSEPQFSPLHNSLYLYLARVLRPVWASNMVQEKVVDGKSLLISKINSEEASFLARHVEQMAKFMHTNQGGHTPGQGINSTSHPGLNLTTYGGDTWSPERTSLLTLRSLLHQTLEVLRLWTILTTHDFTTVLNGAPKEVTDQLRTVSLRDLVLSGRDISRQLIMALMNRYHGDNASIDAISGKLREVCKELYRVEDAKLAKANEMILAAKNNNNKQEKEQGFRDAVALYKQIGDCVNIGGVCSQLASGGWYEGVVDLCLSVANQKDPSGQALHYYKNNEPNDDLQGYHAFRARAECYRTMIDHINQLVGSAVELTPASPTSPPSRPGPPPPTQPPPSSESNTFSEQMINLIVSSNDELAHVILYQSLVESGRTDRLLSITSPYLEAFLTRSNGELTLNNLLWRYYERNRDYYKAAKTLALLADQTGDTPLTVRVEYLSRALMCLSSCEINTATSYADFMLHMEEKKEVARVQLMVLNAVQSLGASGDAVAPLNSGLLDISTLYEKFAEPWQLWECKLAIVHCAGHCEPQLIQTLWTNIIDSELNNSASLSTEQRIDSLVSKLKSLARMYLNSPNYFPLEHIIKKCELQSVNLRAENTSWVVTTLQECGVPITKLISIYHKLYRSGDNIWEVQRAPYHLLSVLAHLITFLTDNPPVSLPPTDRRALREQCLDYIAAYLTDLGASADASAACISSHLKTCQNKLERS